MNGIVRLLPCGHRDTSRTLPLALRRTLFVDIHNWCVLPIFDMPWICRLKLGRSDTCYYFFVILISRNTSTSRVHESTLTWSLQHAVLIYELFLFLSALFSSRRSSQFWPPVVHLWQRLQAGIYRRVRKSPCPF